MVAIQCLDKQFHGVEAVVFDKDGTLANVEVFLKQLTQKRSRLIDAQIPGVGEPLLMAFGMDDGRLNAAGLQAVGSRKENEIAAAAYIAETGRNWMESLEIAQTAFTEADAHFQRKADHTPLFSGTREIIKTLATAGIKVGILSADIPANVEDFARKHELLPDVQACGGVDSTLTKPNPLLLERLCERLGVAPQQTLVVGDGLTDIEMGRAAQALGCVQVTWGWSQPSSKFSIADVAIAAWDQFEIVTN